MNLDLAEVPPFVIGALSVAALVAAGGRPAIAVPIAAVSMIEPHVAAPAMAAMFLWLPRARLAMLGVAAIFTVASLLTPNPSAPIEYFTRLLPAQAASEIPASDQLSLTWILHWLGASDAFALGAGTLSYLIMFGVAVGLAGPVARALRTDALIVLLPPALVMLGGNFIHNIQFPIAIPAALVLASRTQGATRVLCWIAVVLLAVPWHGTERLERIDATLVVAILTLAAAPGHLRLFRRVAIAAGASVLCFAVLSGIARLPVATSPKTATPTIVDAVRDRGMIAAVVWGHNVRRTAYGRFSWRALVEKPPLWGALLVVLIIASSSAARSSTQPRHAASDGSSPKAHGVSAAVADA
jgi:hypothetical protein